MIHRLSVTIDRSLAAEAALSAAYDRARSRHEWLRRVAVTGYVALGAREVLQVPVSCRPQLRTLRLRLRGDDPQEGAIYRGWREAGRRDEWLRGLLREGFCALYPETGAQVQTRDTPVAASVRTGEADEFVSADGLMDSVAAPLPEATDQGARPDAEPPGSPPEGAQVLRHLFDKK